MLETNRTMLNAIGDEGVEEFTKEGTEEGELIPSLWIGADQNNNNLEL